MIKSVEKALNILSYVISVGNEAPVSLSSMAEACQLNAATCSHLVDTLCGCAYLEKVSRKDGYILGPMGYCISAKQYYRQELIEAAVPPMKRLSTCLHEDVSISTFANNRLFVPYTIVYHDDGARSKKFQTGRLYCSASGRVVVAYMSQRRLNHLLESVGYPKPEEWDIPPGREALEAELEKIRARGLAVYDRVTNNLSAVAAPILLDGRLQAVVGTYMEEQRFQGEHLEEAIKQTAFAARQIAKRLQEKLREKDNAVYRGDDAISI